MPNGWPIPAWLTPGDVQRMAGNAAPWTQQFQQCPADPLEGMRDSLALQLEVAASDYIVFVTGSLPSWRRHGRVRHSRATSPTSPPIERLAGKALQRTLDKFLVRRSRAPRNLDDLAEIASRDPTFHVPAAMFWAFHWEVFQLGAPVPEWMRPQFEARARREARNARRLRVLL
jgi:hypothetical protein